MLKNLDNILSQKNNVNLNYTINSFKNTTLDWNKYKLKNFSSSPNKSNLNQTYNNSYSQSYNCFSDESNLNYSDKTREQVNKIINKYQNSINELKATIHNKNIELDKLKKVNDDYEKIVSSSKGFIEELYSKNKLLKEKLLKYKYRE